MKMIFGFLALTFLVNNNLKAEAVSTPECKSRGNLIHLTSIVSDNDDFYSCLFVEIDKNKDVSKIVKMKFDGSTKILNDVVFEKMDQYQAGTNLVILKKEKFVIAQLRSPNFSSQNGGQIIFDFLFDGKSSPAKRGAYSLNLERQGDSWIIKRNKQKFKKMRFIVNKFAFWTIGVESIEFLAQ